KDTLSERQSRIFFYASISKYCRSRRGWLKKVSLNRGQQIVRYVRFPKHWNMCFCTVRMRSFFWAELRAVLQIDLYVEWKGAKFLLFGDSAQSRAWELLALLGLYALWRSRTDHLEVREGFTPAWQHFCDGFLYVSSLLEATEQQGLECWSLFGTRLHNRALKARW
ncbi:unnamed protein product, partial [Ixodes persulcatus]